MAAKKKARAAVSRRTIAKKPASRASRQTLPDDWVPMSKEDSRAFMVTLARSAKEERERQEPLFERLLVVAREIVDAVMRIASPSL
jgi:hypothetical protein